MLASWYLRLWEEYNYLSEPHYQSKWKHPTCHVHISAHILQSVLSMLHTFEPQIFR